MYYLIEIINGTEKAVYNYESSEAAVATFHQKLGNQMKAESCNSELVMVINESGSVVCYEYYKKAEA